MIKSTILHPQLLRELAAARHLDTFVVCDIGFPVPRDAVCVDLALCEGVPSFRQALAAILRHTVVEGFLLMEGIRTANTPLHESLLTLCGAHTVEYADFPRFRALCADARFFVRTGESAPCSNARLTVASGVAERAQLYDIDPAPLLR